MVMTSLGPVDARARYLDLLRSSLTGTLTDTEIVPLGRSTRRGALLARAVTRLVGEGVELVQRRPVDFERRSIGAGRPAEAVTMVGLERLSNLEHCIDAVLADDVPGDLIETGVWRGGAAIFMRGVLAAYGDADRTVWVADSFQGLPPPDTDRFPADAGDLHHVDEGLAVSLEEVRRNFERYGLLDQQVRFLPGWFEETLPEAPIERLAVMRLDGDMYGSTMAALESLYPKLSPGGFVIIDDYGAIAACKQAVSDFRAANGINDPIEQIDWTGVFWQRS